MATPHFVKPGFSPGRPAAAEVFIHAFLLAAGMVCAPGYRDISGKSPLVFHRAGKRLSCSDFDHKIRSGLIVGFDHMDIDVPEELFLPQGALPVKGQK